LILHEHSSKRDTVYKFIRIISKGLHFYSDHFADAYDSCNSIEVIQHKAGSGGYGNEILHFIEGDEPLD
jgi:hypothetical protein